METSGGFDDAHGSCNVPTSCSKLGRLYTEKVVSGLV